MAFFVFVAFFAFLAFLAPRSGNVDATPRNGNEAIALQAAELWSKVLHIVVVAYKALDKTHAQHWQMAIHNQLSFRIRQEGVRTDDVEVAELIEKTARGAVELGWDPETETMDIEKVRSDLDLIHQHVGALLHLPRGGRAK